MDKRKMNSIATWVTEYEIYEYYQSIIIDILKHCLITNNFSSESWDCDDIGSTRDNCDKVFKEITGEDIYSALAAAYGYHKQTIKQKIDREYRRADISARVIANDNKPNGLTDEEKELAFQADFVRRVLNSKKRPPILPLNKRSHYITEEDIVTINQIIINRTRRIYGDSTLSEISPSLKKFYDYIADHYDENAYIYEEDNKISVKTSKETVKPVCEIKVTDIHEGLNLKDVLKDLIAVRDQEGCTSMVYEVTLENGHKWSLSLALMKWVK